MPPGRKSRLDRFFGGQAGAAEKALKSMQNTYGRTGGQQVFDSTVLKRKRREQRTKR